MEERRISDEKNEYIKNILSNGLRISTRIYPRKALVYVTPLIVLNTFICSKVWEDIQDVETKLICFRSHIRKGEKPEYCFDYVEGPFFVKRRRKLCFHTYRRMLLQRRRNNVGYTLIGLHNIVYNGDDNNNNKDFFDFAESYSNIFDFADMESIYYLLKPKYKEMFRIIIEQEMDNEVKRIFGGISSHLSLKILATSAVKHMSKSSFVSFPTNRNSIGKKLLYFEETIVKKGCGYLYFGNFPLVLLGLNKKNKDSENITICIEQTAIKESAQRLLQHSRGISFGTVLFSYKCILHSVVGSCIFNGIEDSFIYSVFVVSDIRYFLNDIMHNKECMYNVDIYRTVGLGPIVRLPGYNVGIHVINYDIHVKKGDITTLDDKVFFKKISDEKDLEHKEKVLTIYTEIVDKDKLLQLNNIYKEYVRVYEPVDLYIFLRNVYHDIDERLLSICATCK